MSENEQKRKQRFVNFEVRGNVVDDAWFEHIRFPSGRPNVTAILILAEVVYWCRPTIVRDETTGKVIEVKAKFSGEFLQRSRKALEQKFGFTQEQIRDALALLEKMNLIKRHRRSVKIGDIVGLNVLFIELNIDRLNEISTLPTTTFSPPRTVTPQDWEVQSVTPSDANENIPSSDAGLQAHTSRPSSTSRRARPTHAGLQAHTGRPPGPHSIYINYNRKKFKNPHKYPPSGGVPPFGGGGVKNTPNAPSRGGAPKGANVFGGGSKAKTPTKAVRKKTPPTKTDPSVIVFETFWSAYPRKLRKTDAQKQFLANLEKGHDIQAMLDSTKLYSDYCKKNEIPARFIKTPPAFLKDVWNDEGSIQEWSTMETQQKPKKIPFSQMPQDAKQRLQRLLTDKQLSDEYGNPLTERSGVIWEFLDTGFWDSLPLYVQKAVVDFKWPEGSQPKPQPQNAPEPDGWRDYIIKAYGNTPRMQGYVKDGWNSISLSTRWDLVREMQQENAKQKEPKNSG